MIKSLSEVVSPTLAVRNVLYKHGARRGWGVFTNTYDACRTVKCYLSHLDNVQDTTNDVQWALTSMGVHDAKVKRTRRGFIVRIPK